MNVATQQLVALKLGQGSWQSGFPTVTIQLVNQTQSQNQSQQAAIPTQFVGRLPTALELADLYAQWRSTYAALNQRLALRRSFAIEIEPEGITNVSLASLEQLSFQLKQALDRWLDSDSFRPVERRLRTQLTPGDEIRLIIETEDPTLRRFPWHLWRFFEDYPLAEVALSASEYSHLSHIRPQRQQVRILAILGNSTGIDIQQDRALLEHLPQSDIVFLVEPTRPELDRQLWDEQGWDILFFAGHSASQTDGSSGEIAINPQESLTISQLKHALNAAIQRGLQFAIFNSCDGLGLARDMADLHIPQLVVMREPVPDPVAQNFLRHLLTAFAGGQSFYRAVRQARARLQGLETQFPCASYLPVICQNPTAIPPDWQSLIGQGLVEQNPIEQSPVEQNPVKQNSVEQNPVPASSLSQKNLAKFAALTSLVVTSLALGLRWLGGLQALELTAFDALMRARPAEVSDPRILVVEVTEKDTSQYGYPLEDKTLAQALAILSAMQPRAIGVDMHRYQPRGTGRAELLQQFQQSNLFTVCWFASADKNFAPPPEFSEAQRTQQVGFSDLALDGTNQAGTNQATSTDYAGEPIRRQILSYDPKVAPSLPDCPTPYSFSFQLAFRYLYSTGTQPLAVNAQGNWQFGPAVFPKLPARFVGYQNLDGLSSQVMLNYRQGLPGQKVTLNQVLQGQVSRSFVENRLVLLGTTAPIARDSFMTPIGEQAGIWVHAHQVSQILSAALNQRPLIWGLPQTGAMQWGDAIWIWVWSGLGAGLAWGLRSWHWLLLANGIGLFLLYQICLVTLTQAGWLPLVPATITYLTTSAIVQIRKLKPSSVSPKSTS